MLIFAYGSNMSLPRLTQRVPSAIKVCNAYLSGYSLVCNKISKDGSAKANIMQTDNSKDVVWGVIFNITEKEKIQLDKAEGLGKGYIENTLIFTDESKNSHLAQVYIADTLSIGSLIYPYDWYKEFIVTGAVYNKLPIDYILQLKSITCTRDPDEERRMKNYSILLGN